MYKNNKGTSLIIKTRIKKIEKNKLDPQHFRFPDPDTQTYTDPQIRIQAAKLFALKIKIFSMS